MNIKEDSKIEKWWPWRDKYEKEIHRGSKIKRVEVGRKKMSKEEKNQTGKGVRRKKESVKDVRGCKWV